MTRDEMIVALQTGICRVQFTKVNGEFRDMSCTLNQQIIPAEHTPSSDKVVKENLDVIRVFDTTAQGWRSFRVDSVKEFNTPLETA